METVLRRVVIIQWKLKQGSGEYEAVDSVSCMNNSRMNLNSQLVTHGKM